VIQTNNVELDRRGYIYVADRAKTGLHIVQLTGAAVRIVQPCWDLWRKCIDLIKCAHVLECKSRRLSEN
jgi:hypothetical protein